MAQVKLILREEVPKLGHAGDVVSVKPGFARNFLLPQGKASLATEARVAELEHNRRVIEEQQAKALKDLEAVKRKIESTAIEIEALAGEEGKLFGSVTSQQIAAALKDKGVDIDRRKMQIDSPIKSVGEHLVDVRLHRDLSAELKIVVSAKVSSETAVVEEVSTDASLNVEGEQDAQSQAIAADAMRRAMRDAEREL